MLRRLRRARYDRVYDLQTSSRSTPTVLALWPRPPRVVGHRALRLAPAPRPDRDRMHTLERQADQLRDAGIWPDAPPHGRGAGAGPVLQLGATTAERRTAPASAWRAPFALLIPGASASPARQALARGALRRAGPAR